MWFLHTSPRYKLLKDRPEFPIYTTGTVEAAYTQWPLSAVYWQPRLYQPDKSFLTRKSSPSDTLLPLISKGAPVFVTSVGDVLIRHARVNPPSPEEIALKTSIVDRMNNVHRTRSIPALYRLRKDLFHLADMRNKRQEFRFWIQIRVPFPDDMADIDQRLDMLIPDAYALPVQPPIENRVWDVCMPSSNRPLEHFMYLKIYKVWIRPRHPVPKTRFRRVLTELLATDIIWSCVDFEGHTINEYNEESRTRQRTKNIEKLLSLPYPPQGITQCIKLLEKYICYESSVSTIIWMCEWFTRKRLQMAKHPPKSYMFPEEPWFDMPQLMRIQEPLLVMTDPGTEDFSN